MPLTPCQASVRFPAVCSNSRSEHGEPIRDCQFLPGARFVTDRCEMRKRIALHQLRVGMYVAGIDCSWFRTPFLKHRFLVKTEEQIERLRRSNIHAVDIDPAKGLDITSFPIAKETLHTIGLRTSTQAASALDAPRSLGTLNQELTMARETCDKLVQSVKTVFDEISKTGAARPGPINEAVQEITIVTRTLSTHATFMAMSYGRHLDASFNNHSLAVCTLAMIIGQALGYDLMKLHELATGALLHDIGLLQLPRHLFRTSMPLSGEDLAAFHHHPRLGAIAIEAQRDFPQTVRRVAAEHHATPDGQGYPAETSAGSTAEASRIVMIADRYDELLTGFGGLRPLPSHAAIQQLFQEGEFGRLDLGLVSLFIKLVGIYPVYSFVELNTKERGMITSINPATLHQPIVTLTYDERGSPYGNPPTVDLSIQDQPPLRSIERVVTSESGETSHAAA
jgi:putative nucleotidyltransferase with HDIG domain